MRFFCLIICLFVVANARPQSGYNYQPPSNVYGQPDFGISTHQTDFTNTNVGVNTNTNIGISDNRVVGGIGNVHRHVYVYTAPQEQEIFQQKQISVGAAQKHYKIIFIKTPSPPSYAAQTIQAQAQNQEKTIIYVLAKRPEGPADVNIATPNPTQPSKPEVYFIRYKTQKQATGTGISTGTTGTGISTINTGITGTGISTINTGITGTGISTINTGITGTGIGTDYTGITGSRIQTNYGLPPGAVN